MKRLMNRLTYDGFKQKLNFRFALIMITLSSCDRDLDYLVRNEGPNTLVLEINKNKELIRIWNKDLKVNKNNSILLPSSHDCKLLFVLNGLKKYDIVFDTLLVKRIDGDTVLCLNGKSLIYNEFKKNKVIIIQ